MSMLVAVEERRWRIAPQAKLLVEADAVDSFFPIACKKAWVDLRGRLRNGISNEIWT
jgi:hypothetical protein